MTSISSIFGPLLVWLPTGVTITILWCEDQPAIDSLLGTMYEYPKTTSAAIAASSLLPPQGFVSLH